MPSRWIMPVMLYYSLDKDWAMWVTTLFYLSTVCVNVYHIIIEASWWISSCLLLFSTTTLYVWNQIRTCCLLLHYHLSPICGQFEGLAHLKKKKLYTGYLTLFKVACRSMYTLVHNATVLKSDTVHQRPLSPSFVFFVTNTVFSLLHFPIIILFIQRE